MTVEIDDCGSRFKDIMAAQRYIAYFRSPRSPLNNALGILLWLFSALGLLIVAEPSSAADISSIGVRFSQNEIYVTATIKPDAQFIEDINEGLTKELIVYVDLFRVWSIWPNEFINGRRHLKTLKNDPIKREYVVTTIEGNIYREKRFKDPESMIVWAMTVSEMKLANIGGLEAGSYFVKVTVESLIRKLPPVIGYFIPFIPEKEFSISKKSPLFQIPSKDAR